MIRNPNKHLGVTLLSTLLVGLPFLAACGGSKVEQESQTVEVRLTENDIEMPMSLTAGPTMIEVTNAGTINVNATSFGSAGFSGSLVNSGTIVANSGTLNLGFGTLTHNGGSVLRGNGAIELGFGNHVVLGTTTWAGGNMRLNSGSISGWSAMWRISL